MRIGDGCATVTGYRLPLPLFSPTCVWACGKAGARHKARSQDTGLVVLVEVPFSGTNFSVKEKDEASPFRWCAMGFVEAFILRFAGV